MRQKICRVCGKIIDHNAECCKKKKDKSKIKKEQLESDALLRTARWYRLRERVLKRDKYLCQRCLIKYNIINSKDLTGHHIKSRRDYPSLVFDINNILCICRICNLNLEREELNHELDFIPNIPKDDDYVL